MAITIMITIAISIAIMVAIPIAISIMSAAEFDQSVALSVQQRRQRPALIDHAGRRGARVDNAIARRGRRGWR